MPSSAFGNMTFDSIPPPAALLASQWRDTDITPAVA
jgi:hypothetical protein